MPDLERFYITAISKFSLIFISKKTNIKISSSYNITFNILFSNCCNNCVLALAIVVCFHLYDWWATANNSGKYIINKLRIIGIQTQFYTYKYCKIETHHLKVRSDESVIIMVITFITILRHFYRYNNKNAV